MVKAKLQKYPKWPTKAPSWKFTDVCSWLAIKSFKSLSRIYYDLVREPDITTPLITKDGLSQYSLSKEVEVLRRLLLEVAGIQKHMVTENEELKNMIHQMSDKLLHMEEKLGLQSRADGCPSLSVQPPPPPPPPLPSVPNPTAVTTRQPLTQIPKKQVNDIRRLLITPQDILSVKLRKTKMHTKRDTLMQII